MAAAEAPTADGGPAPWLAGLQAEAELLMSADEEALARAATIVLMLVLATAPLAALARRPRLTLGLSCCWLAWFSMTVWRDGQAAWDQLRWRGDAGMVASQALARAAYDMVAAWALFFLPFLGDVAVAGHLLWKQLTWQQRCIAGLVVLCVYVLQATYRRLQAAYRAKRAEALKGMAEAQRSMVMKGKQTMVIAKALVFEASFFFGVIPAVWYADALLPATGRGMLLGLTLWALPTALSASAFRKQDKIACRVWLAYWSIWPALELLSRYAAPDADAAAAATGSAARGMQGSSAAGAASAIGRATIIRRGLVMLALWCQYWDGSRRLHAAASAGATWCKAVLGGGGGGGGPRGAGSGGRPSAVSILSGRFFRKKANEAVTEATSPSAIVGGGSSLLGTLLRLATALRDLAAWGMKNKIVAAIGGCFVGLLALYMIYKVLGMVSGALTFAILWGAAFKAAVYVSDRKLEPMYEEQLSFWVLLQVIELSTHIPIAGSLVHLWEPLLLACSLVFGSTVLRQALNLAVALTPQRGGAAAAKKPRQAKPKAATAGGTPKKKEAKSPGKAASQKQSSEAKTSAKPSEAAAALPAGQDSDSAGKKEEDIGPEAKAEAKKND